MTPAPTPKPEKTGKDASQVAKETAKKVSEASKDTGSRRANSNFMILGTYSPMDLMIPSKYGGTLGFVADESTTLEFEYLQGSLSLPFIIDNLGEMKDEKFSIIARSYSSGKAFNVSYGITYFKFRIKLGSKYLSAATNSNSEIELIDQDAIGFNLGVGHRWILGPGFTFGVDWISWNQPVSVTRKNAPILDNSGLSQQDKDNINAPLKLLSYVPRLVFLKIQLGFTF